MTAAPSKELTREVAGNGITPDAVSIMKAGLALGDLDSVQQIATILLYSVRDGRSGRYQHEQVGIDPMVDSVLNRDNRREKTR